VDSLLRADYRKPLHDHPRGCDKGGMSWLSTFPFRRRGLRHPAEADGRRSRPATAAGHAGAILRRAKGALA